MAATSEKCGGHKRQASASSTGKAVADDRHKAGRCRRSSAALPAVHIVRLRLGDRATNDQRRNARNNGRANPVTAPIASVPPRAVPPAPASATIVPSASAAPSTAIVAGATECTTATEGPAAVSTEPAEGAPSKTTTATERATTEATASTESATAAKRSCAAETTTRTTSTATGLLDVTLCEVLTARSERDRALLRGMRPWHCRYHCRRCRHARKRAEADRQCGDPQFQETQNFSPFLL